MGTEGSSFANMGKCCASEEIEEVIKRDGKTTLSFENGNTTGECAPDDKTRQERELEFLRQHTFTDKEISVTVRIQAVMRGILARKLVRTKLTDVTLNSFANVSQMTGMNER